MLKMACISSNFIIVLISLMVTSRVLSEPVFIVNASCKVNSIDVATARRLWLGKQIIMQEVGTLTPIEVDESSVIRQIYLEKFLNKSPEELRQHWARLMFTGKATPPQNIGSDKAVVDFVAREKDAIGIIERSFASPAVKIIGSLNL